MAKVDDRITPVDEVQLLRAAACDWRLSRGDLGTFAVILRHCNAEWSAFPGPKKIAEKARLAVTNVKACILRLERFRYIKVERRGLRKKNRYVVLDSPTCPTRRARIPSFKSATGRADKPSSEKPSGHAGMHQTGHADMKNLGMPARHEDALKTPKKSPLLSPSESQEQQQPSPEEEQRLTKRAREAYQLAKDRGNVLMMESLERHHLQRVADLIEEKAA